MKVKRVQPPPWFLEQAEGVGLDSPLTLSA